MHVTARARNREADEPAPILPNYQVLPIKQLLRTYSGNNLTPQPQQPSITLCQDGRRYDIFRMAQLPAGLPLDNEWCEWCEWCEWEAFRFTAYFRD
jgi:hypothetical protein